MVPPDMLREPHAEDRFRHGKSECMSRQMAKLKYNSHLAGLTLVYSNGQVEGQINTLKLIKRTMYGRAGFPLLRQRVLHAL